MLALTELAAAIMSNRPAQSGSPAIEHQWVHISYPEDNKVTETYGFVGSQGTVNLEGLLIRPPGTRRQTLLLMMHPSSTLQLLPLPTGLAHAGHSVLCVGSRYAKNDTALIFEKVVLDMGASVRYAKEVLGYDRVVLLGWSGGGSLSLLYQSQAECPTLQTTPAGDPVDLCAAQLLPADGLILEAAHRSRAHCLLDWIDPSVLDEVHPECRDSHLDLYAPGRASQVPYPQDWLTEYRAAQGARIRRITAWVQESLHVLRQRGGLEMERAFVTHRTMADPRFLDGSIDPNDRAVGRCYLGDPETVNTGAVGLARVSMLRSWMSQWSIDHSNADGERCARQVRVPLLAIEHGADDAVPQPDVPLLFEAYAGPDKRFHCIQGANHYFKGQPQHLQVAVSLIGEWIHAHGWH